MEDFNQLFDDSLLNIDKVDDQTIKLKQGERRMVAVLFADIKGFTNLSETLDHEEVQTLIDQLMKIFSHCVELHAGYVDKYTGDEIMALFGAKAASEVDTQRAINTAMLMLKKLKHFNSILRKSEKYGHLDIDLSIRIGINTGMVTTGAVGKEREGDYTAYGDTVNLASRMESNAPINTIMVAEDTMELVKDYFIFKDHGFVEVKGKSKPISVFIIQSKKDLSINTSTPFIGREKEIKTLSGVYKKQTKETENNTFNKINFIGITAEAGVGKSRLIDEYLKTNKQAYFSLCHASNISSKPYYLFIRLIKDVFNISQIDSLEESKRKFEAGIEELYKINSDYKEQLKSAMPFIGFLIGLSYKDERLKDRQELQNHLNISIKTLLKAVCKKANAKNLPYILILDDLHWIDKMSAGMLEYIVNTFNIENKRDKTNFSQLLVLATYRMEYKLPDLLESVLAFTEINLTPLTKEDSISLIEYSTKNLGLNEQTVSDLIEKSKGNPFFIEEWVSLLREKHKHAEAIDESRGIKNVYEVPRSINALILARIDSLEKTLKLLLQKATIIGEDFFIQILSQLEKKLGGDTDIDKPVHTLEDEDFIHHYINQLDHYKFKHMLTRDVAYSTILISNKVLLHKAVAEIIEEYFADKLETFYFDLAIHYDISKDYDKALKYLYLAGRKHKGLFDYTHATQCFKRIISIVESENDYKSIIDKNDLSEQEVSIYTYYINSRIHLGNIFLDTGDWDKAKTVYDTLDAYNISDAYSNYLFLKDFGQYYNFKRDFKNAIAYFNKSLGIAKKLDNKSCIATITGKLADCEYDMGNLDNALTGFKEELSIFEKINENIGIALAQGHIGMVLFQQGNLDKALTFFNTKYNISKQYDSKQMILQALGNIALIHNIRGQYDKSLEIYKEVMETAEDIHDLRAQAQTLNNIGILYKNLTEYDTAIKNWDKQLLIAQKIGDKHLETQAYSGFAIANQKIGNFDKSIEYHNKNIKIKTEIKEQQGLALTYCNLSNTFFDIGDMQKAKKNLNQGINIFNELGFTRAVHLGNFEFAKILLFENNYKKAVEIIKPAIQYFTEIDDTVYLIESLIRLSKLERLNNNIDSALSHLNKAIALTSKINHTEFEKQANIEIAICKINQDNNLDVLLEDIEKQSDEIKAYIYFNIHAYLGQDEAKSKAEKLYLKLYEKINRFEYKYYLNLLK